MMLPRLRKNRTREPFGGDVEALVGAGAVERHGIQSGLTLDDVAAFAWVPLEAVVAGAEEREVRSSSAVDEVVAVSAEERLVPAAADEPVVGEATVNDELHRGGVERRTRRPCRSRRACSR